MGRAAYSRGRTTVARNASGVARRTASRGSGTSSTRSASSGASQRSRGSSSTAASARRVAAEPDEQDRDDAVAQRVLEQRAGLEAVGDAGGAQRRERRVAVDRAAGADERHPLGADLG